MFIRFWVGSNQLDLPKCVWGAPSVEFFGMVVSANGINIPHARTKALSAFKRPVTRKQLRLFLGLVSFYRAFLPSLATHTKSLSAATSKSSPNNVSWSSLMISDFDHILSLIVPNTDDCLWVTCYLFVWAGVPGRCWVFGSLQSVSYWKTLQALHRP